MNREIHVRFWGGLEVKLLRSTRLYKQRNAIFRLGFLPGYLSGVSRSRSLPVACSHHASSGMSEVDR